MANHAFHQHWRRAPAAPHPCQHLVVSVSRILATLMGMQWYLTAVSISISLMTQEVEHLFLCLFAICVSSLLRCLWGSLMHFLTRLFIVLLLSCKNSSYISDNISSSDVPFANISPSCGLSFILSTLSFAERKFSFSFSFFFK